VRRRRLVIIGWLVLVAMAVLGKNLAGGSFANDLSVSGTDSEAAHETM
jgi:RND superfamily putative drug exporter